MNRYFLCLIILFSFAWATNSYHGETEIYTFDVTSSEYVAHGTLKSIIHYDQAHNPRQAVLYHTRESCQKDGIYMTVIYYTIEGKKKKGVLYHTKENSQRTNIIQETIVYFSNGTKKKVEIIRKNKLGQLFSEVSAN